MLPVSCLAPANIAAGAGDMQGGCHDHHTPAHCPARSCCYTQHRQPAAVTTPASPRVVLSAILGSIAAHDGVEPADRFTPIIAIEDSSPPLFTVLRI
jgi:hypothetical protein